MTDEAKALGRAAAAIWVWVPIGEGRVEHVNACGKAADLIETQPREIERLREALRNIRALATKRQNACGPDGCLTDIECFARAALAGDTQ